MSLSFPLAAVMIPEDILIEILVRLPAYSLMRFKCVSKHWFSLISSRYFTNLFVKFSSSRKRERRVFADVDLDHDKMVFSSRLFNLDATTYFVQQLNRDLTMTEIYNRSEFVNAVRGLMCFRVDNYRMEGDAQIRIINFTTRQVLSLPLVDSNILLGSDQYFKWNYFGYDPVNDKYKVLSIISSIQDKKLITEIQVFVLGDGASWKSLTFSPLLLHDPYEGGISINGVLYYGAWSYEKSSALMSFDLSSEELNLIELSWENHIKWKKEVCSIDLINYQDHVAVFDDSCLNTEGILNLLVLEDAGKSKWSNKVLVLPCDQIRARLELKDTYDLRVRGTSGSREVTLCGRYEDRCDHSTYAFYDLEKNHITRVFVIDPPYSFRETILWEDVESIMYLEL